MRRTAGDAVPPPYVWRRRPRLEPGVNVFGYAFAEHGVGEGARQLVRVLRAAGVRHAVVPYERSQSRQAATLAAAGGEAVFDVNLVCINADTVEEFLAAVGAGVLDGRYNVGLWCWEVESFPPWMAAAARYFDEIWGCSTYTARAIGSAVSVPVWGWQWPLLAAAPPRARVEARRGDPFLFLFCFDYTSVFQRKNPLAAVAAFRRAFPPTAGVRLLVKSVNGEHFPEQEAELLAAAAEHPGIEIVDGYLQRAEQRELLARCDAYVSLHRAEGLGLTLAEAMALGKPVIATAYSGNLDFMDGLSSFLVPYGMVPIPPGCGPYPSGKRWAEPDIEAAAWAMRRVFEWPGEAGARARRGADELGRMLQEQAWTGLFVRRLAAIRATLAMRRRPAGPFLTAQRSAAASAPTESAAAPSFRSHGSAAELLPPLRFAAERLVAGLPCGALDEVTWLPGGGLRLAGWAHDPRRGEPAAGVVLLVDGQQVPLRIALGGRRSDVAMALGRDGLASCGWRCTLPASLVRREARVEAYAALVDGRFGPCGACSLPAVAPPC